MPNAFCAAIRINLIKIRAHRNGVVGAFGFADVAIDAFVSDHEGHGQEFGRCFTRSVNRSST